ncbi:MAG: FG-GAP-like repeat-containing protein, partial [Pseudomonadota bacterium]|nr:FG-GAP-like repeat-containing protein [Pseudomonadota bacterium]
MDGDGDLDIVSASYNDDTIAWYESNAADDNLDAVALAGVDYTATSGTLTFAAGETSKTFTVPVLADSYPENNETVTLTLSNASNATISDATGTLTITDDDSISFTAADIATSADGAQDVHVADMDGDGDMDIISASLNDDTIAWYENDGAANPSWTAADIATSADAAYAVHVADMDGDGDLDIVSASYSDDTIAWYESNAADKNLDTDAIAGVDYTAASGTLTFDAGDTTATFTVPVLADSAPENNETATMTLSSASNATLSDATGTLTITDDDSISFTGTTINQGLSDAARE